MSLDAQQALVMAENNRLAIQELCKAIEEFGREFDVGSLYERAAPYARLVTLARCARVALQKLSKDHQ